MKKIIFIIPALTGGGAERVFLHLLTHLDRSRFDPLVVLFERRGEMDGELPHDLPVFTLKGRLSSYGLQWLVIFKFAALLKRTRPDAVVSFMSYTNLVVLVGRMLCGLADSVKVIACERVSVFYPGGLIEDLVRKAAIRLFYRQAEIVVVNAREMGDELRRAYGLPDSSIALIHNPVDSARLEGMAKEDIGHPWFSAGVPVITAVGRLTTQKGFEYLIRAMGLLSSEGVECRLIIMGTGVEESRLKKLTADLNLSDRVAFLGYQPNPYKYMARATMFVLSSLYEGFPNALLEAQALGLPCVATRCPTGPAEIITDGVNGLLVPPADHKALADAIKRLLGDRGMQDRLGAAAKDRAAEFGVDKIVRQFEGLIENVCAGSADR